MAEVLEPLMEDKPTKHNLSIRKLFLLVALFAPVIMYVLVMWNDSQAPFMTSLFSHFDLLAFEPFWIKQRFVRLVLKTFMGASLFAILPESVILIAWTDFKGFYRRFKTHKHERQKKIRKNWLLITFVISTLPTWTFLRNVPMKIIPSALEYFLSIFFSVWVVYAFVRWIVIPFAKTDWRA